MKILAHRGFWETESEKNTLKAFEKAFKLGYGIETDIRDYRGEIVIAHNPADENARLFSDLLELHEKYGGNLPLALNIKADGLYLLLPELPKSAYLFDMSVPEQYIYIKRGYQVFTRSSEFETAPILLEQSTGVWLDQFTDCSHIENTLETLLKGGKMISIVSPELHGRDYKDLWEFIKRYKSFDNISLCTDIPKEAEAFFK